LVVSDSSTGAVSVLLGNGTGTFQPRLDYNTGGFPTSVAVADMNGDNNLDLIVADSQGNSAQVLLGRGDGTFKSPVSYNSGGRGPFSFALGDFNHDGRLDIAGPDDASGAVILMMQILTGVDVTQPRLSFGVIKAGTTKTLSTAVINLDRTTLTINTIQITGSDKDEFCQVNTCGSSLATGQSCTITVTFKPMEAGSDLGVLSISDNGPGSPQQVSLSGAGCVFPPGSHYCLQ
jgi:hypothetical protein